MLDLVNPKFKRNLLIKYAHNKLFDVPINSLGIFIGISFIQINRENQT